jgi:hypothetical protein
MGWARAVAGGALMRAEWDSVLPATRLRSRLLTPLNRSL